MSFFIIRLKTLERRFFNFIKPTNSFSKKRLSLVLITSWSIYFLLLIGLCELWYSKFELIDFHWFNDSHEWLYCDKLGHFYIAFIECRLAVNLLRWCGWKSSFLLPTAVIWSFIMQSGYEIFDGFAINYGASAYDLIANFFGSLAAGLQFKLWNKIIVSAKFSYHFSPYSKLRPELLGNSFWEKLIKDYNGHTYWFALNLNSISTKLPYWPKWLVLNLGYGGDGLLGGEDNIWLNQDGNVENYSNIPRAKRVALSFDIRWDLIFPKSKFLSYLFYFFEYYKFPYPALEWHEKHGFRFYWFYW